MSRGGYGYGFFKQKQYNGSIIRKSKLEFTREFDSMLSNSYDSYLDFSFRLYSEFYGGTEEKESVFEKVYEAVSCEAYEKSKEFLENYIENVFSEGTVDSGYINNILKEISTIYYDHINDYYLFLGHEYLSLQLERGLADLKDKDCVRNLRMLDPNYIRASLHKITFLFSKVRESSEYVSDIFAEEVAPNVMYKLKDRIVKISIDILKELYEVVVNEVNDCDFDIGELLVENSEKEETFRGGKLEYIDDYRRLNKLASDNGFKYVRCRGDHGIFKNENGLVVIPQGRTVGKGLSFKIQKAIYSLSSENA